MKSTKTLTHLISFPKILKPQSNWGCRHIEGKQIIPKTKYNQMCLWFETKYANCQFRTRYCQRWDQRLAVSTKPTPTTTDTSTTATTPPNNSRQVVMRSRDECLLEWSRGKWWWEGAKWESAEWTRCVLLRTWP